MRAIGRQLRLLVRAPRPLLAEEQVDLPIKDQLYERPGSPTGLAFLMLSLETNWVIKMSGPKNDFYAFHYGYNVIRLG
jgi:hypothetical protein